MRFNRLTAVFVLLILMIFVTSVMAQEETSEPEATTEPETTETVVTEAAPEETQEVPVNDAPTDSATYTVQAGDNLFRIALRFGTTTNQLAEANNIANPALIFVGQVLTIPGNVPEQPVATAEPEATTAPEATIEPEATAEPEATEVPSDEEEPSAGGTYTVQAGDTLFRIAVRNNTTVNTLLGLNPDIFNQNLIFVGQEITLPEGSTDADTDDSEDADESDAEDTEDTEDTEGTDESADAGALEVDMAVGIEVLPDTDYASLASLATQLGVSWVKLTVDWAEVEPEEGTFDFSEIDSAVAAFEGNFDIVLLLTGAPDWSRPSSTELALQQPTYGPPDDLSTFGTFAGAVATQYEGRVAAYEIWFQPNLRINWMRTNVTLRSDEIPDAGLSDVRYIDLLEAAYDAIKEADEDALVLTAGLAPTGNNDQYNSIDNFIFFEALLEQGVMNFSDGINVHLDGFSNPPDEMCCGDPDTDPGYDESGYFYFAEQLDEYREILDENGGAEMPLWVTRFGWGTAEGATGDGSELEFVTFNTAEEQAQYTTDALAAGDEAGFVQAMFIYNLNGCFTDSTTACYYSMIDANGAGRPVFEAVSE
ncbi:MAG: LysM peptidoglycan-binding domain-containing protein [Chloroflexota bacterium]